MKKALIILFFSTFSSILQAEDNSLILLGQVKSVTAMSRDFFNGDLESSKGGLVISNACGRYEATLIVKDVIIGIYEEKEIVVQGSIGEWCQPRIFLLPENYIFELEKLPSGYRELSILPLYTTYEGANEGLAALPYIGDSIGKEAIKSVEFEGYYPELYFDKLGVDEEFWDYNKKSWFKDGDDAYYFSKGIPYASLKKSIIKEKVLPK